MNPKRRDEPRTQIVRMDCQDQLWLLSGLFPFEREFLSVNCLPWQDLEGGSRW